MKSLWLPCGAGLLVLSLVVTPARAGNQELATVEAADAFLGAMPAVGPKCIPPALLRDAKGVAVFNHVVKAGFLLDRRFGHGVLLVRGPGDSWSTPLFVTLEGGGLGVEAGIEATDLVLIFRTEASLERVLKGKGRLRLGADVTVAAGPLGKEVETTTTLLGKPEVYAYSRSRGLFAGLSLEGDHVVVDGSANEAVYHVHGGHPMDVLAIRTPPVIVPAEHLKEHLVRLCGKPVEVVAPRR